MGKIRENNPLFTTKLHFVENFLRNKRTKGFNKPTKRIDFIEINSKMSSVVKSGNKCENVEKMVGSEIFCFFVLTT
jgi:hypothetical protein